MTFATLVALFGLAWCVGAVLLFIVLCVAGSRLNRMPAYRSADQSHDDDGYDAAAYDRYQ